MRLITLGLATCSLLACTPDICTKKGCVEGLFVDFSEPIDLAGSYTFIVTMDDETVRCETSVPFVEELEDVVTCDGGKVALDLAGFAQPDHLHGIPGLEIAGFPETVSIEIFRDTVLLASDSFTPEYHEFTPNGVGCEPVCTIAQLEMDLTE